MHHMERATDDSDGIVATLDRRKFLKLASAAGAAAASSAAWADEPASAPATTSPTTAPATLPTARETVAFPEKTDLYLLTDRPPQLETPLKYFRTEITPNEAFFVRWHLAGIPTSVDLSSFRLNVGGHVDKPLKLSMEDLQKFEQVTVVAVNQCSGNSRSYFEPRVPGGQWQHGAMGNARWTGVRLADLLAAAKAKEGAVDVTFQGMDRPVFPATPTFIKALDYKKAVEENIIVAYAMNGQTLPMLNGFPVRLVVPGWFATYWVKALTDITVMNEKFHNFWMDKAYRVPKNPRDAESPMDLAKDTVPISNMLVRSLFVTPEPSEQVSTGVDLEVQGLAFDGGSGIKQVELSVDGKSWLATTLGPDLGKYSFRRWSYQWKPRKGTYTLRVRATTNAGETQVPEQNWNRSGYARNQIETLEVAVV